MNIRAGIVRVPYHTDSDFGTISVGNSITNTPGTVVVDIDEKREFFYVHWIYVTSPDEETCFKSISEPFEKSVRKFL
jgi:multicomponent Na+:H+ antiporter subunit E